MDAVAAKCDVEKKVSEACVGAAFALIAESLSKGEDIAISGFGSFEVSTTNARKGRNPKTGESIDIPAGKKVKFKVAKGLKDTLA